jgi:succinate dehydrogenase / fumarate reductase cytochrome b subunit
MAAQPNTSNPKLRPFYLRKLFSFLGVAPLGLYVLWHLWNNAYALAGAEPFNRRLQEVVQSPFYRPLVILLVYVPLLYHAVYGAFLSAKSRPNLGTMPNYTNFKYVLRRISGIGIFLFVGAHVYKTTIEPRLEGFEIDFHHMKEGLGEPLTLLVYVFGLTGVAYHLADGLWLFGVEHGLWTGERGMRRAEIVSVTLGGLLLIAFGVTLAAFLR